MLQIMNYHGDTLPVVSLSSNIHGMSYWIFPSFHTPIKKDSRWGSKFDSEQPCWSTVSRVWFKFDPSLGTRYSGNQGRTAFRIVFTYKPKNDKYSKNPQIFVTTSYVLHINEWHFYEETIFEIKWYSALDISDRFLFLELKMLGDKT